MNWLAWSLLSALFAGMTAIFAKIGVSKLDSNLATAIRTVVILIFSSLIAAWTVKRETITTINGRAWLFLVLSGTATGLSWLCYFRALQLGKVSKVAPIDKLSVVVAIILSIIFLDEKLTLREGTGAGFIVVGALLIALK